MPSTTLLEIPPVEQAQMRAILRRARYGYLLAFHILLLCADGRTPTEIAAFLFCWVLLALSLDHGKGTLKDLCQYLPRTLKYWTLMRMVHSGQWDEEALVTRMASDVLRWLPPPADGVLHLSGDQTRKEQRGRQHPLGYGRRVFVGARSIR